MESAVPSTSPLARRILWALVLILLIGAQSLAVSALPPRFRLLFLLPLAFGIVAAGICIALRNSLKLAASHWEWWLTTALALGGFGQVIYLTFEQYRGGTAEVAEQQMTAKLALEMMRQSPDATPEEIREVEEQIARQTPNWNGFLTRRYTALGNVTGRASELLFAAELLLVIGGTALGRRLWSQDPAPELASSQTGSPSV